MKRAAASCNGSAAFVVAALVTTAVSGRAVQGAFYVDQARDWPRAVQVAGEVVQDIFRSTRRNTPPCASKPDC
jgi:hypothetical protein